MASLNVLSFQINKQNNIVSYFGIWNSDPTEKIRWRRYRIGIYFEPIRTIPIHSDICIRANANHSDLIRSNCPNESEPIRNQV